MDITWTSRAKSDFNKILEYLYNNWGAKEVNEFIDLTDSILENIAENPQMFIESTKKRNVHKGFITKQNSMFYKFKPRKKEIILLTFWDNRKDPKKRPY
jgi:plasmid stabilization system protein ParE